MMRSERHPVCGVIHSLTRHHTELTLEFSRYIHFGPGRTLSREIFHVQAETVDARWLEEQIGLLSGRQELALHSRVLRDGRVMHIPLVDFARVESIAALLSRMRPVRESLPVDITLYDSGRSLHGYYFCLVEEHDWYRYLGRLLLCNNPLASGEELVDSRWIGHSLENGFSALRWSCNSDLYQSLPELIDIVPHSIVRE